MASPFKRLCIRRGLQQPLHYRCLHQSSAVNASTTSDLDSIIPTPALRSDASTNPDTATPLSGLKDMELSTHAHRELEQHRELREMVRLAAWEMPLLSSLSKPFEPPKQNQILRWRYTSYMGENHPAARKVVVELQPSRIPRLEKEQLSKLLKIAGARYKGDESGHGILKMSCESFETQAQNKRYLAETIMTLIAEAKDPNADDFADLPLDQRHAKTKIRHHFPEEWVLTPERKKELEARRRRAVLDDGRKVEQGALISGLKAIEDARKIVVKAVEQPLRVEATRGMVRASIGRREMGQVGGKVN